MFCTNCGKIVPDGAKFCTFCGTPAAPAPGGDKKSFEETFDHISEAAGNAAEEAKEALNSAGKSIDSAFSEVAGDLRGDAPRGGPLRTDRSLVAYVLLSLITCGIYGFYFIYTIARDVNVACSDDDEETSGLGMYILLSFITCGLYSIWWEYKLGNRLQNNGPAYGLTIPENGTTIILWRIFGALICGVGSFIGSYILIKNVNLICDAYNRQNGLTA